MLTPVGQGLKTIVPPELQSVVTVGARTYGPVNVRFWDSGAKLIIGKFCSFSEHIVFYLGGNHRVDWVTTYPFSVLFNEARGISGHPSTKGDIVVGNDVWIGEGSLILSGVRIGDGSVVGAGTIVSSDVPPYSVFAGNPGRVVRQRFDPKIVKRLLRVRWWDWEESRIAELLPLMLQSNIDLFLKRAEEYLPRESVPVSVTPTVSVGNGQESAR